MSSTDYSHTTLANKKASQTQFADTIGKAYDAAVTPGLVRMGGGTNASVAIPTATGATVAGATNVRAARPAATSAAVTTYSLSKSIVAAAAKRNNR